MTPREEYTAATQQLSRYQVRLDEARREFNRQRRQLQMAFPHLPQAVERNARIKPLLGTVRAGIAQVEAAPKVREQKYEALPDKSEVDGWC